MSCDTCREEVSAGLDDEADPALADAVERHLSSCTDCARWQSQAVRVTRLTRTGPAETGPDLVATVLQRPDLLPRRERTMVVRGALAAVGLLQVVLGALVLLGVDGHNGAAAGPEMLGAGMVHMSHEAAAWNLALGVALVVGAVRVRLLPGLLPGLGVFLAVLTVLSGLDLLADRVQPARVVSHLVLVVGFVLAAVVARRHPGGGTPGSVTRERRRARRFVAAPSPSGQVRVGRGDATTATATGRRRPAA